jgi:hypothetical protein
MMYPPHFNNEQKLNAHHAIQKWVSKDTQKWMRRSVRPSDQYYRAESLHKEVIKLASMLEELATAIKENA